MFLDLLTRRNPAFVEAAVALHQAGEVPANSFLLDLDAIRANGEMIAAEAARLGLRVMKMTKQLGRNPRAMQVLSEAGIPEGVAVDVQCAYALAAGGSRLGHVGHLVQIPRHEAGRIAALDPAFWTVFSDEKAAEASAAAQEAGRVQRLLMRVVAPGDRFYPGHEGGFPAAELAAAFARLSQLPAAAPAGVTTFPAMLFDQAAGEVRPTPNLQTLAAAAAELSRLGLEDVEVNAPGTTSVRTLATLAGAGATQVEPGHALTGTTPWHALEDLPEHPAMLYVTEVSHAHAGRSYCFGGGLYVDPVLGSHDAAALVGSDPEQALGNRVAVDLPEPAAIDYYAQLHDDGRARAGDTVVLGFRAQAFVTRARVVPVSGVSSGRPRAEGVWTADGAEISW
jgi:predicted amino acid racemase